MSLRARLLLLLAALSIVGLLAADVATYTSERSFLASRVDHSAAGIAHGIEAGTLDQLTQTAPGVYVGGVTPDGRVFWRPPQPFRGQEALPQPRLSKSRAVGADEEQNVTIGSSGTTDYRAHFEVFSDGSKNTSKCAR